MWSTVGFFSEFNYRERKPGVLNKRCTRCTREYFRNYYARHRDVYALHTRQKNAEGRVCNRERLLGYLRLHPCVDRGETDRRRCNSIVTIELVRPQTWVICLAMAVSWTRVLAEIERAGHRLAWHGTCESIREGVAMPFGDAASQRYGVAADVSGDVAGQNHVAVQLEGHSVTSGTW